MDITILFETFEKSNKLTILRKNNETSYEILLEFNELANNIEKYITRCDFKFEGLELAFSFCSKSESIPSFPQNSFNIECIRDTLIDDFNVVIKPDISSGMKIKAPNGLLAYLHMIGLAMVNKPTSLFKSIFIDDNDTILPNLTQHIINSLMVYSSENLISKTIKN